MKAWLCVLLASVLFLTGCSGDGRPEIAPAISAKDFNTRLENMEQKLNAGDLAEISTLIINAPSDYFDDIEGWYHDRDTLDKEILKKVTRLDSRPVEVELKLKDDRVSSVRYSFKDVTFNDFAEFVAYQYVGSNLQISTFDIESMTNIDIPDEHAMIEMLGEAVAGKERLSLTFIYDFINSNSDESEIVYSFHYSPSIAGDIYNASTTFQHKLTRP